jgi:hypothetical protein
LLEHERHLNLCRFIVNTIADTNECSGRRLLLKMFILDVRSSAVGIGEEVALLLKAVVSLLTQLCSGLVQDKSTVVAICFLTSAPSKRRKEWEFYLSLSPLLTIALRSRIPKSSLVIARRWFVKTRPFTRWSSIRTDLVELSMMFTLTSCKVLCSITAR